MAPVHGFAQVQVHHRAPAAIQTKMTVNEPGDKYELEADRVADQVMRISEPPKRDDADLVEGAPEQSIHRKCAKCEEEEEVQAKESPGQTPVVTSQTQASINGQRGRGEPLPPSLQAFYEPRIGADFSRTRVHTGPDAARTARWLKARAFTVGHDVFFNSSEFQPGSNAGRRLLAHELTHSLQQEGGHARLTTVRPMVQRDIDFAGKAATARYTVVDPRTGKEYRSGTLAGEFVNGLSRWLALDAVLPNDRTEKFEGVQEVKRNAPREKEIKSQFRKVFGKSGLEMLQDRTADEWGLWEQVRETITFGQAWKTWEGVRDVVEGFINGFEFLAPFQSRSLSHETVEVEESNEAPSYVDSKSGWLGGGSIRVHRRLLEDLKVSADVHRSFDGFWIILHELMHIRLGLDDPIVNKYEGERAVVEHVRNPHPQKVKRLSKSGLGPAGSELMGEVVSKLNVLRVGFGLPLRTSYSDEQGTILFSKEGAIGAAESKRRKQMLDMRRVEFAGVVHGAPTETLVTDPYIDLWLRTLDTKTTGMWTNSTGKEQVRKSLIKFKRAKGHGFEAGYRSEGGAEGVVSGDLVAQTPSSPGALPGLSIHFQWWEDKVSGRGLWSIASEELEKGPDQVTTAGRWWYGEEDMGFDGHWIVDIPVPDKRLLEAAAPPQG